MITWRSRLTRRDFGSLVLLLVLIPLHHHAALAGAVPADDDRTRLLVLTDISSLTAGVAEPDDGQSLIRLLLYANDFEIEGLCATANLGHGRAVRPDLIQRALDAYADVLPNLRRHDPRFPPVDQLRSLVKSGQPNADRDVPVKDCVGEGKETEASRWIIDVVDRADPRPLWIVVWGGSADLAQALWTVRHTRSRPDLDRFLGRIRVHAINDQDTTGPWLRDQFPGLFTIVQQRAYRGMYRGGDESLSSPDWVETHIEGHGALGDLYPNYRGGDIFAARLGPVRGIKEGDTPSFLALLPNGLTDLEHPELGSWGGRFAGPRNRLIDVVDPDHTDPKDPDPRMGSVHRWRPAFQADFQARLDWCVKPFEQANHPPDVRIEGPREYQVEPGSMLTFDAAKSSDPDGDELDFAWSIEPALKPNLPITGRSAKQATLRIAERHAGQTIPVLLTVTDRGQPPLTRYGRVLLKVGPIKGAAPSTARTQPE